MKSVTDSIRRSFPRRNRWALALAGPTFDHPDCRPRQVKHKQGARPELQLRGSAAEIAFLL